MLYGASFAEICVRAKLHNQDRLFPLQAVTTLPGKGCGQHLHTKILLDEEPSLDSSCITVVSVRRELFRAVLMPVFFPKVPNNGHPIKSSIITVFIRSSPSPRLQTDVRMQEFWIRFPQGTAFWEDWKTNVRSIVHGSNEPESAVYDFSYLEYLLLNISSRTSKAAGTETEGLLKKGLHSEGAVFTLSSRIEIGFSMDGVAVYSPKVVFDDLFLEFGFPSSLEARCSLNMLCSAVALVTVQCIRMIYEPEKNARSTTRTYVLQSSNRFFPFPYSHGCSIDITQYISFFLPV
ncbi:hypothetical protein EDD85DRAFT_785235 [Armillaria nabsnona]|nr:hypothetical protein EDD85DRAFT_785235 [Armillaria nabsnona]